MSRIRDRSGDIVEGDLVYWLAEPEMRFAYGIKYLRFNLAPLARNWEAEQRGKREW